jgi:hypothetical protein
MHGNNFVEGRLVGGHMTHGTNTLSKTILVYAKSMGDKIFIYN